jgi:hypothetical protein
MAPGASALIISVRRRATAAGGPVGCVNPIGPSERRILAGLQTGSEP